MDKKDCENYTMTGYCEDKHNIEATFNSEGGNMENAFNIDPDKQTYTGMSAKEEAEQNPDNKGKGDQFIEAANNRIASLAALINLGIGSVFEQQVGGDHYKEWPMQPWLFSFFNNLPYYKYNILKRALRFDLPTGKGDQDLDKIIQECQMLKEARHIKNQTEI